MDDSQTPQSKATPSRVLIEGLRGFATAQAIDLAVPTGKSGSGLTFIVGPNNCGKSTCVEALRVMALRDPPSFSVSQRNKITNSKVRIEISDPSGVILRSVTTVDAGGSETHFATTGAEPLRVATVASRRNFRPYFNRRTTDRSTYMHQAQLPPIRGFDDSERFPGRLQRAMKNQAEFNSLLGRVLRPVPQWQIDRSDHGMYFLRFSEDSGVDHTSDGVGDGIISVFHLVDALYDSKSHDLIVIDEPELSLHPSLQRRLMALFEEYSRDRQIVLATHSPYFVSLEALTNGASLSRLVKKRENIEVHSLSAKAGSFIASQSTDLNNPHVLGLDAREVFFLNDQVILVEGQDDVICFEKIVAELEVDFSGSFFGWGVGGASKMADVAGILRDLGFTRVVGIVDKGKEDEVESLRRSFPRYRFIGLPAHDVRTKKASKARAPVEGVLDKRLKIREKYREEIESLIESVNSYLTLVG